MTIDSMIAGVAGGVLIGLAAGAMLLMNGRIAGISGIYGGVVRPVRGDTLWRVFFVAGLLAGALLLRLLYPAALPLDYSVASGDEGWALLIAAGLMVGFGTRMGGGCTSGHGVCGLGRMSQRSLVATIMFIGAGVVAVWLANHVVGG
jgi:hypothetical protein